MKLYFKVGDTEKLVGSPRNQEEMLQMIVADMKTRFVAIKGRIQMPFTDGARFYAAGPDGAWYTLKA